MTPSAQDQDHVDLPDFVALKSRFDRLPSGPRADLRKVAHLAAIPDLPAYYRWLGGLAPHRGLQRVAFFLPHVGHRPGAADLGRQLRQRRISELRLFQVLRSEPDADLEYLRRLLIHADLKLDWREFGKTLHYWGTHTKRRILQDYFTPHHEQPTA